jgi:hypothetical protein
MFQDPSLRQAAFDLVDSDLLHLELVSLHKHLKNDSILRRAAAYSAGGRVRLFAVSSLGRSSAVGRVASHGVIPFRCLDPIKWFLFEAGVIGASA